MWSNRRSALVSLACAAILASGCMREMRDQPRYEPLEASDFFLDGLASRPRVPGTVARGTLGDPLVNSGLTAEGALVPTNPLPLNRALIERGGDRYAIYCTPCHGAKGDGLGMVVQRGFKEPTSFHDPRLRSAPDGYFFDVMTQGFGEMSDYAAQLRPADRWAVVAYIRALQLSQHVALGDLPSAKQRHVEAMIRSQADAGDATGGPSESHP